MKVSQRLIHSLRCLALLAGAASLMAGCNNVVRSRSLSTGAGSFQQDMDAYCTAKMNDGPLSRLSADDKKDTTFQAFFSKRVHSCLLARVIEAHQDLPNMRYLLSDLTHGFLAPASWHAIQLPLHIAQSTHGSDHHLYVDGYWSAVSSDKGQQSATDANNVDLTCDYGDKRLGDRADTCTETDGYIQFDSVHTDTQTYHVVSWNPDEVIATDSELGLSGSTATTMIIHPETNDIEVFDRTKMDEKQPSLMKGLEGKTYGDHFELHGGVYSFSAMDFLFQCDEDGIVTNMRIDVAERHKGDVFGLPEAEWNAGSKANSKYTSEKCAAAMKEKVDELR